MEEQMETSSQITMVLKKGNGDVQVMQKTSKGGDLSEKPTCKR